MCSIFNMGWFENCSHDWEIKSKDILPSAFEQMSVGKFTVEELIFAAFTKKIIIILACKKCGELDKTIEENP